MPESKKRDSVGAFAKAVNCSEKDRLLIIDLDETLWLRNSTESFLAFATPCWLVAAILATLDCLRPWQIARLWGCSRTEAVFGYRDWIRVLAISTLTPWNLRRWRQHATSIGPAYANQELIDVFETRSGAAASARLVVVTHGFAPIAKPLVTSVLPDAELLAAPLTDGSRIRRMGKADAVAEVFGTPALQAALVVTDHEAHDRDIIQAAAQPFVVRWPNARFEKAHAISYLPFRYTRLGKHAGRNHLLRVFLGVDGAALLMAIVPASPAPTAAAIAGILLVVSFFIVFEIGYHENDKLGLEREEDPHLTEARLTHLSIMDARQAWCWSVLIGAAAIALVVSFGMSTWTQSVSAAALFTLLLGLWCAILLLSRGLFALFNRLDKPTRRHVYLPLQLCKGMAIVVVLQLPATMSGVALLLSIALSRWLSYVVYRCSGRRGETPDRLYRLFVLLSCLISFGVVGAPELFLLWSTWLVVAWAAFTARQQLVGAWRAAKFL